MGKRRKFQRIHTISMERNSPGRIAGCPTTPRRARRNWWVVPSVPTKGNVNRSWPATAQTIHFSTTNTRTATYRQLLFPQAVTFCKGEIKYYSRSWESYVNPRYWRLRCFALSFLEWKVDVCLLGSKSQSEQVGSSWKSSFLCDHKVVWRSAPATGVCLFPSNSRIEGE